MVSHLVNAIKPTGLHNMTKTVPIKICHQSQEKTQLTTRTTNVSGRYGDVMIRSEWLVQVEW